MTYAMMAPPLISAANQGGIAMAPMIAAHLQMAQQHAAQARQLALQAKQKTAMNPGILQSQINANNAPMAGQVFSALSNPFFAASQRGGLDPTIETMVSQLMRHGGPYGAMEAQNIANQAGKGGGLMQALMASPQQQQMQSPQSPMPQIQGGGEPGMTRAQAQQIMNHRMAVEAGTAAPSVVGGNAQALNKIGLIQRGIDWLTGQNPNANSKINAVKNAIQNQAQQASGGTLVQPNIGPYSQQQMGPVSESMGNNYQQMQNITKQYGLTKLKPMGNGWYMAHKNGKPVKFQLPGAT